MKSYTIPEFRIAFEQEVDQSIASCARSNSDWIEVIIVSRILDAIRKFNGARVGDVTFTYDVFAQRGQAEKRRGDIALIASLCRGDAAVTGASYLEAKQRSTGKEFASLDEKQRSRFIANGAISSQYLFLNSDPISIPNREVAEVTRAFCIGIPLQKAIGSKKLVDLTAFGLPLSRQFADRFLFGNDLSFDDAMVGEALASAATFLVCVGASRTLTREFFKEISERHGYEPLDVDLVLREVRENQKRIDLGRDGPDRGGMSR